MTDENKKPQYLVDAIEAEENAFKEWSVAEFGTKEEISLFTKMQQATKEKTFATYRYINERDDEPEIDERREMRESLP